MTTKKPLRNNRNDSIAIKKLTKLVNKLKKVNSKKFDMHHWIFNKKEQNLTNPNSCGTVACALGWATTIFPRSLKILSYKYAHSGTIALRRTEDINKSHKMFGVDGDLYPTYIASYLFKISPQTSEALFMPDNYTTDGKHIKNQVVERLLDLITALKNKTDFEYDKQKYISAETDSVLIKYGEI